MNPSGQVTSSNHGSEDPEHLAAAIVKPLFHRFWFFFYARAIFFCFPRRQFVAPQQALSRRVGGTPRESRLDEGCAPAYRRQQCRLCVDNERPSDFLDSILNTVRLHSGWGHFKTNKQTKMSGCTALKETRTLSFHDCTPFKKQTEQI